MDTHGVLHGQENLQQKDLKMLSPLGLASKASEVHSIHRYACQNQEMINR
jgi:hypothetical protein